MQKAIKREAVLSRTSYRGADTGQKGSNTGVSLKPILQFNVQLKVPYFLFYSTKTSDK